IVACDIGAVIADVAEEGAKRTFIVEGQSKRADRSGRNLQLDAHIHRNAQFRMDRSLKRARLRNSLPGLVLEQVDGMTGMVPQQMIRPASGFALRVHVRATEEERLHDHVLDVEFTSLD